MIRVAFMSGKWLSFDMGHVKDLAHYGYEEEVENIQALLSDGIPVLLLDSLDDLPAGIEIESMVEYE